MLWVVLIVLLLFWLFGGCYLGYDPARPVVLGNTLLPWCCVVVLALIVYFATSIPVR